MNFNTYLFVLLFLPVSLTVYYLSTHYLKKQWSQTVLFLISLSFYAYAGIPYLALFIISLLFNYFIYKQMGRNHSHRKALVVIAIFVSLLPLFFFKYSNFFIENVNLVFNRRYSLWTFAMPLGISFYSFRQIAYIVDAYRGQVTEHSLLDYLCFATFFPHLVSGPIVTPKELLPQFQEIARYKFSWDAFSRGLYIFVLGLAKKVLIAEVLGQAADFVFTNYESLFVFDLIIGSLSYTLQLYFDFSGYSDMAIGIGHMFNFDLPQNFNSPYKAMNISDFWKRWHMSLTNFLTTYIYIPLGGNRKGRTRTYINIFIVYIVSGFWHGANWTFIIWGLMHGFATIIYRTFKKQFDKFHPVFNWGLTFGFVSISWVIFRASTLSQALTILKRMFSLSNLKPISRGLTDCFNITEITLIQNKLFGLNLSTRIPWLNLVLIIGVLMVIVLNSQTVYERGKRFKPTIWNAISMTFLLTWSIVSFAGIGSFIYAGF